jgi:hypothetical protein
LEQIGGFLLHGTPVSTTNKTDWHDITEILLKVALNTIILTPYLKRTIIMFGTTLLQPLLNMQLK